MSRASAGGVANWPRRFRSWRVLRPSRHPCSTTRRASIASTAGIRVAPGPISDIPIPDPWLASLPDRDRRSDDRFRATGTAIVESASDSTRLSGLVPRPPRSTGFQLPEDGVRDPGQERPQFCLPERREPLLRRCLGPGRPLPFALPLDFLAGNLPVLLIAVHHAAPPDRPSSAGPSGRR